MDAASTPNSAAIAHGQRLIDAYTTGDRAAAIEHQSAMFAAIRQQPAAQQAQRIADIDRAIAASDGCYFCEQGDRDRARLAGVQ